MLNKMAYDREVGYEIGYQDGKARGVIYGIVAGIIVGSILGASIGGRLNDLTSNQKKVLENKVQIQNTESILQNP